MCRLSGKGGEVLFADGQKHPGGQVGQRVNGGRTIGDPGPEITLGFLPGRPLEGDQGDPLRRAGFNRIPAHSGGEGMGRIDDMGNAPIPQEIPEARDTAKTADPGWQRLHNGGSGPTGVGKDGVDPFLSQMAGQKAGFRGPAQEDNARHV